MYYLLLSGYLRTIYKNRGYPEWLMLVFEDRYYWCQIVSKIVPIFLWLSVISNDIWWHQGRKGRWPKSDLFYHFMSIFITANHMISLRKIGFDSRRLHQKKLMNSVSYIFYLVHYSITKHPSERQNILLNQGFLEISLRIHYWSTKLLPGKQNILFFQAIF